MGRDLCWAQHGNKQTRPPRFEAVFGLAQGAVLVALLLAACKSAKPSNENPNKGPLEFPVEVVQLEGTRLEAMVTSVGAVEAFESIQVTARVAGAIDAVHFREGEEVKANTLLVEIEPQRYQLGVAQAKATLDRTIATRAEAEREIERASKLAAEGIGTGAEVSSWQTRLDGARAEESQARAALALASLNLRDARVRAPISGKIQSRNIQTGQYVQAGTVLATLIDRDPLLLRFKVSDSEVARLSLGMSAEFRLKDAPRPQHAKITFIADAAEPGSRLVPVVAEVDAEDSNVRPGTFVEVRVPLGASDGKVVVPETAVRPSERGFLAFVIDGTSAHERVLQLGLRTPDGRVEVAQGLSPGEILVVRGGEALREGAKVRIVPGTAATVASPSAVSSAPSAGGTL
jgi:membrane fusion protein, multidrug efflux system